jgi:hypothetical protein
MGKQSHFYEKPVEYMYYISEILIYPFEWVLLNISTKKSRKKNIKKTRKQQVKKYINIKNYRK